MIPSPYHGHRRTRSAGAVWDAPFPFISTFRNGPRRQGFAPPRSTRAPLTAPGRSENLLLREGKGGKPENQSLVRLPLLGAELHWLAVDEVDACSDAGGMVKLLCPG
jgi:hypothetical protein